MTPPDDGQQVKLTPKLHALGRTLILQFHLVLKTMRIHELGNKVLLVATENLKDTINTLWAALKGSVRFQFVEGTVYLNDQRLRITGSTEQIETLETQFSERGLGGLAFTKPVDTASLARFLQAFVRPVESEQDLEKLRSTLLEMKDLALELLGEKQFADGDEELRIDRKTFALQTYAKAIVAVREFVKMVKEDDDPSKNKLRLKRIVQDLVDIATERVNFLLKMSAIKSADEYVFNHAANTCVLAVVLGKALKVDRLELVDLGLSALLADVAFAFMPSELVDQHKQLEEQQRAEIQRLMVAQVCRVIGRGRIDQTMLRRLVVAYEHHMPYRNPETGAEGETHLFSRIVAVADVFDALTTTRPWREGFTADEALKILVQQAGTKLDPLVVKVLVNLMGMYPLGSAVRLDSGEIAIVYHNSNSPQLFERPWVRVVRDVNGERVRRTIVRNLAETEGPGSTIVGIARPDDLDGIDAGMAVVI